MASPTAQPTVSTVSNASLPSRHRRLVVLLLSMSTLVLQPGPVAAVTHADRVVRTGEGTFTVALYENPYPGRTRPGGVVCTGSLLTDRVVVTAAHCTDGLTAEHLSVGQPAAPADVNGKLVPVVSIAVHPSYRPGDTGAGAGTNDVALLLLAEPVGGKRVALPTAAVLRQMPSAKLTMFGYGLDEKGRPATGLRMASVRDMSAAVRANPPAYGYDLVNLVPAGGYRPALKRYAGACTGDSGGPLVLQQNGKAYLVGVTSYVFADSKGGCDATFASSFLRVSTKAAWITSAQAKLSTSTTSYRLTYRGEDPVGDGTAGNHADVTSLQAVVTADSVLVEAVVTPRRNDSELYADISVDTDGNRVPDLKAFGQQGVVSDREGAIRCQGVFTTDRRTLRWTMPRSCFKGQSLSMVLVATERSAAGSGTDSVGLNDLALPRR